MVTHHLKLHKNTPNIAIFVVYKFRFHRACDNFRSFFFFSSPLSFTVLLANLHVSSNCNFAFVILFISRQAQKQQEMWSFWRRKQISYHALHYRMELFTKYTKCDDFDHFAEAKRKKQQRTNDFLTIFCFIAWDIVILFKRPKVTSASIHMFVLLQVYRSYWAWLLVTMNISFRKITLTLTLFGPFSWCRAALWLVWSHCCCCCCYYCRFISLSRRIS